MKLTRWVAVFCAALCIGTGATTVARAEAGTGPSGNDRVQHVSVVVEGPSEYHSTVDLVFDQPVTRAQADQVARRLNPDPSVTTSQLGPTYIACGGSGAWSDSNGRLSLQLTCSDKDYLAWGYTISPTVQAIIVGPVNETGLRWWLDGSPMAQNAQHLGYPKNYLFHGTMSAKWLRGHRVEYQDYLTFRHNVGGGGSGSITWAGRVYPVD